MNAPSTVRGHRGWRVAVVLIVLLPVAAGAYYFGYNVGTISVLVTDDAITEFRSLNITFSDVQVHSDGALTGAEWVSLHLATTTIDLTALSDNITATIGLDRVAAGRYSQVRLIVSSAEGVLTTGQHVLVTVPSGELRTQEPFEVRPQGALTLLVRILVAEGGGTYVLRPAFGGISDG